MLGFVIPEHDGADANTANVNLSHTLTSPDRDLDFDLASLIASAASGGWVDWRAGHVLGGTGAGTDTGVGKYAGDGTIDLSVLGGGGNKADECASSPGSLVPQRRQRATLV